MEYERPLLSPCFAHLANLRAGDPNGRGNKSVRPLPLYVACALEFFAARIEERRSYPSTTAHMPTEFCPRVDARAEGSEAMVGGWLPQRNASGAIDKACSPWFSLALDENTAPWAFCREGEPYRTIAALEAMATLVSVIAFAPWIPTNAAAHVTLTSITDNQGNQSALTHLSTTRFPLNVVTMELACQMDKMCLRLDVRWAPRTVNVEADDLSNGNTDGFDIANKALENIADIPWVILDKMMKFGLAFEKQRSKRRNKRKRDRRQAPGEEEI